VEIKNNNPVIMADIWGEVTLVCLY